jgi:DNA-binding HxlR family transcriptional regulator
MVKRLTLGKVIPMTGECSPFCPRYHRAMEILGRRWAGAIIRAMLAGRSHFSEITAVVPGLSDRLLSERLKELEAEEIITRTVIADRPVRIEYHLTEKGKALGNVVSALSEWAETWIPREGSRRAAGPPERARR